MQIRYSYKLSNTRRKGDTQIVRISQRYRYTRSRHKHKSPSYKASTYGLASIHKKQLHIYLIEKIKRPAKHMQTSHSYKLSNTGRKGDTQIDRISQRYRYRRLRHKHKSPSHKVSTYDLASIHKKQLHLVSTEGDFFGHATAH
jgi:hypothetical protein